MLINEENFRRLFGIPESERLMMMESVMFQIRGFIHMHGFAYLTTSMLCLEGTVFGAKALFCCHYNLVKSKSDFFDPCTNTIRIGLKLPELYYIDISFTDFDNYDIFMELLASLIEEKHQWKIPNSLYPNNLVSQQRPDESKLEVPPSLDAHMMLLLRQAMIVVYEKGDILIEEGSTSRKLVQILHGSAQIVKGICMDRSVMAEVHAGTVLGEQPFVLGTLWSTSIEVTSEFLYAAEINHSSMSAALELNEEFCAKFYQSMSESLARRLAFYLSSHLFIPCVA
jgi:CRP-like cAMP-binding protein